MSRKTYLDYLANTKEKSDGTKDKLSTEELVEWLQEIRSYIAEDSSHSESIWEPKDEQAYQEIRRIIEDYGSMVDQCFWQEEEIKSLKKQKKVPREFVEKATEKMAEYPSQYRMETILKEAGLKIKDLDIEIETQ